MSFLQKIFKRKPTFPPADLSVIGVDMHSHFIAGIDDGAQTKEDSIALVTAMHEFGYKKVITTPHVMSDFFRNTTETILKGLDKLREAAKEAEVPLLIEAAAEYYLDFDFERKIETEKLLTIGKNYLLFEVSYMNPPDNLYSAIFKLQSNGYIPVLAHPERYPFWFKTFEKFEEIKEKGVLFQMNINSLTGYYSGETKKIAEMMIDKNMIDFIGSDCHHVGHVGLMHNVRTEEYLHKLLNSGRLRNSQLL